MGSDSTLMEWKKPILACVLSLLAVVSVAQQDALYSQYMFNAFAINPAYAGSRESVSAVLLARAQWVGLDGAPSTQSFSIHSPFKGKNMALGLNVVNDAVGPTSNLGAFATYAYHVQMYYGTLSLGLRGGVFNSVFDQSKLDFKDGTDPFASNASLSATVPSFDFGAYYYTSVFYAGLATTHLTEGRLNYKGDLAGMQYVFKRHYMLSAGYAFTVSENLLLKPSVMFKLVEGVPPNIDLNVSALFHEKLSLGASVRLGSALVLLTEYNITNQFRMGYSYDIVLSRLRKHNSGSHEVFIGFDFNLNKEKSIPTKLL